MRIHLSDGLIECVLDASGPDLRWECDNPGMLAALEASMPRWSSNVQVHPGDYAMQIAKMAATEWVLPLMKVEGAPKRRTDAAPPPPGTVL